MKQENSGKSSMGGCTLRTDRTRAPRQTENRYPIHGRQEKQTSVSPREHEGRKGLWVRNEKSSLDSVYSGFCAEESCAVPEACHSHDVGGHFARNTSFHRFTPFEDSNLSRAECSG
ncbi:uncharacterized protein LOC143154090 isoform X1 [Ptiloglossa arizonensis]|uniref:uncharacterized protein LOC143154090 isoform X1 n=1 Tax=Ptiloglossa arizonensis TaxID=3350558 RepID=UPI003F9F0D28